MEGHASSMRVIIAAMAGNMAIAVSKSLPSSLTGSAAMFSEAIHSTVDTGNELLLLFGRRSRGPAGRRRAPVRLRAATLFLGVRRRGDDLRPRRGRRAGRGHRENPPPGAGPKRLRQLHRPRASRSRSRSLLATWPSANSASSAVPAARPDDPPEQGPDHLHRIVRGSAALVGLLLALIGVGSATCSTCRCSTESPRWGSRWCSR